MSIDTRRIPRGLTERYAVDVPEGICGDWRVKRFTVGDHGRTIDGQPSIELLRASLDGAGIPDGTYTRLLRGGRIVMSDTPWEIKTNAPILRAVEHRDCRRVLIAGLGLGMVVQHALRQPHVERVDVVEIAPEVIALVGPTYTSDPRLTLREGDALALRLGRDEQYDAAWCDIHDDLCADNMDEIRAFGAIVRGHTRWWDAWSRREITQRRKRSFAQMVQETR